jgi:hypothetical protein
MEAADDEDSFAAARGVGGGVIDVEGAHEVKGVIKKRFVAGAREVEGVIDV